MDTSAVGVHTAAAAVVVVVVSAAHDVVADTPAVGVDTAAAVVVVLDTSAVGADTAAAVAWRGRKEEDGWRRDHQHCQHCRCCCVVGGDSENQVILEAGLERAKWIFFAIGFPQIPANAGKNTCIFPTF